MGTDHPKQDQQEDGGLATAKREKVKRPRLYKVLLHNDDYTTMEFVIQVLMQFFQKDHTEATQIMLNVHYKGIGVCGLYTREIAETKVGQVNDHARKSGYPLQCSMEVA
ncbi:MAG: ATP-dependent Clp protease adapter ClpS [Candidatus Riflebacteria bacterium]|nr:ATP-dependent Clp protease adapter ClpS [Candidatus Riflebacteria bacterium]